MKSIFHPSVVAVIVAAGLTGCGEKPVTRVYETAHEQPVTCLRIAVFPPDDALEKELKRLYDFSRECDAVLEVRHKENIGCNSNQNIQQKALSAFPHHFLRMEVRRGLTPVYSYYIDLQYPADEEDARAAFVRLRTDLKF